MTFFYILSILNVQFNAINCLDNVMQHYQYQFPKHFHYSKQKLYPLSSNSSLPTI